MSISVKKTRIIDGGVQIVYLPNSPNPDFLPTPIDIFIHPGQYWMGNQSNIIFRIRKATPKVISFYANLNKTDEIYQKAKKVDINSFLEHFHLIKDSKLKKKRNIKIPEKQDKLNIL